MKKKEMSFRDFLFGETRSGTFHPSQFPPKWIAEPINSNSGVAVTPESVRGIAAVYACIKVLSEDVGALPLVLYNRLGSDGKERAVTNPLYAILHDKPNRFMTSIEWREMMICHVLLRGNAYNQILRDRGNRVSELIPLNPVYTRPEVTKNQELVYIYQPPIGKERTFKQSEILHIKGQSNDGILGESPISIARETFGFSLATQIHGSKSYANGTAIRGVLKMPGHFEDDERIDEFRKQWKELYSGPENTSETAILEDGMEWQQISMSMRDAQFLELTKLNGTQIAGIFRMPPHKIGILDNATFSNIEHQGIEYVTGTLLPWLKRIEQAIQVSVLGMSKQFYCEFLVDGLLRGDIKSRYDAYAVAVTNGWLTRNEVRKLENLNPETGLDEFLVPLNMGKEGDKPEQTPTNDPKKDSTDGATDEQTPAEEQLNSALYALEPIIKHECGRLIRRRNKAIEGKNFNREREIPVLNQSLTPLIEAGLAILRVELKSFELEKMLENIEKHWDDAVQESEIESVRLRNYKLVLNSILAKFNENK